MRKRIFLTVVLIAMALSIGSGCTVRHYHYREEQYSKSRSSQRSGLAAKHFTAGREHYLGCRFRESITHLEKAIVFESSNKKKALYCIYIGADWFYLEAMPSAKNSFSRAKQYSWKVRPPKAEFPFEIIKLYEESP